MERANPLDELSSADIAVNVARVTKLPESTAVTNAADSESASLAIASNDDSVVSKPQIISGGLKSNKDIFRYEVQKGDTFQSLAEKFGITTETIKLSNSLDTDTLTSGISLLISPVNGLVYRVQPGDTPESLANKFHANVGQIIAFNDVELTGKLKSGDLIVIPDGSEVTSTSQSQTQSQFNNFAFAGGNYASGWCTDYASARAGVPGGWGNASSWAFFARLSGWSVSNVPKVGAVAQTSGGWGGHVGIVEDIRRIDGHYEIKYSDMNGLAGFGRVGYSGWVSSNSRFQNYIYH